MPDPEMFIVAGPPGGGKSTVFSLRNFTDRIFNAGDRAAELNGGSYFAIPLAVRHRVNREFEIFIRDKTTMRSKITFEQAKLAKSAGFHVFMTYVALDTFERHVERVTQRALLGGHAASETTLRRIYQSSLENLPLALEPGQSGIDEVRIFDNSGFQQSPRLALEAGHGSVTRLANEFPAWLRRVLNWTESDLQKIRSRLRKGEG